MSSRVIRSFYRILFRTAKQHDKYPGLKALLIAAPGRFYDHRTKSWKPSEDKVATNEQKLIEPYVRRLNGGGNFYLPEVKAVNVIRESFRSPMDGNTNKDLLFDAATGAIKSLERNLAKGREIGIFEQRPPSGGPRYNISLAKESSFMRGQFLLAHPLLSFSLNRGVLIVLKHEEADGTLGVMLNRKTKLKVADLMKTSSARDRSQNVKRGLREFADCPVYKGGGMSSNFISILHPHGDLEGSCKILDGVYWQCDLDAASEKVRRGEAKTSDFKFIMGFAGWGPRQLHGELENHAWLLAKAGNEDTNAAKGEQGTVLPAIDLVYCDAEHLEDFDPDVFQETCDDSANLVWSQAWRSLPGKEHEHIAMLPVF
uniref:Uncharacterized protein n=1 Tax=Hanusia phi TaxID=3032 RepID=A0A7S0EPR5_9CRYP|mmetsp:Transcript_29186/g.66145  ORF Transcript_29186/g.66145 Transcript_29186/m.66145 type:complete len:371 (+) Transcript_29186:155-1267(+)